MPMDLYLTFCAAAIAIILLPGPNVSLIVANSMNFGTRRAAATIAGTSTAIAVQMVLTVAGMSSLMLLMADVFDYLRYIGAAYLVYLGLRLFLTPEARLSLAPADKPAARLFWQGFLISLTNPKTLLFYSAFFPQFIAPGQAAMPQLVQMAVTFFVLAVALDSLYALLARRLRRSIASTRGLKIANRITGSALIAAGAGLAVLRRGNG